MKTRCRLREETIGEAGWIATVHLFKEIKRVIGENNICVIGLGGGTSVAGVCNDLEHETVFTNIIGQNSFFSQDEWEKIHFFYADERVVNPDDEQSNYRVTKELFLDALQQYVGLPEENIHRFYAENNDKQSAMNAYTQELCAVSEGKIHILLLGVGEEGHIAALYPEATQLTDNSEGYLWVNDCPKLPAQRVTISPKIIYAAEATFLFFFGDSKKQACENLFSDAIKLMQCPAKLCLEGEPQERLYIVTNLAVEGY